MVLVEERVEKIGNYLKADPIRAKKLLEMPVEEALAQMNADGCDFTEDELKAFDEAMVMVSECESEELDEEALDNVAGGFLSVASAALVFSIVSYGAPYAWKAGQWIGKKIVKAINKKKKK